MAEEPVPEPVRAWLADVAGSSGLSEEELLGRLRSEDGEAATVTDPADLEERVADLEAAVDGLDADLDSKIEDVRARVVQLKLEGEGKADEDHGHPPMAARLDRLADRLEDVEGEVASAAERLGTVESRAEAGFSNYEDVLEYLVDATDELHRKVATLAEATIDAGERLDRVAGAEARRAAADDLRATAADHGVTAATCGNCGDSVSIGLLSSPECPHCGVQFTELEPRRGLFRSSVLHAGQHPALEGEVAGDSSALRSLARDRRADAPPVRGGSAEADSDAADADEVEAGDAGTEDGTASEPDEAARPITSVTGVGPAYAERLGDEGVETVGELALADPERLAADADIDHGRVERLVRRARERVGEGG